MPNLSATIANGQSLSDALDIGQFAGRGQPRMAGLIMPAAWTTADITFLASFDGGDNFHNVFDAGGNEYKVIGPAASRFIILDTYAFFTMSMMKIRSGTASASVPQGAERVITAVLR